MDIQSLKADIASLHAKLDFNSEKYMEKLTAIECQTIKTNGRVTTLERIVWSAMGGGSMLILIPTLQAIINKLSQ